MTNPSKDRPVTPSPERTRVRAMHAFIEGWAEHPVLAWACRTCERIGSLENEKPSPLVIAAPEAWTTSEREQALELERESGE